MFNKKLKQRVSDLEILVRELQEEKAGNKRLDGVEKAINNLGGLIIPEYQKEYLFGFLGALQDYLRVDLKTGMEEDPCYPKPEPKMRKCYKLLKKRKII